MALVLAVCFFGFFFGYPVITLVIRGLRSIADDRPSQVLFGSAFLRIAWFSLWQAVVSTVATLIVGLPAAFALARFDFAGRALFRAALVVPFVLPTVVVAGAFESVFTRFGLDSGAIVLKDTVWAVLLAHVFFNYAVVVRVVGTYWESVDRRPAQAARVLGASARTAFVRITLPQLRPALVSAAAIVFLFSFTSFGVILLLGGPGMATIETEIWRYAVNRIEFDVAAAVALLQLLAVAALITLTSYAESKRERARRTGTQAKTRLTAPRGRQWLIIFGAVGSATALCGIPIFTLIERSLLTGSGYGFANYEALGTQVSLLPTSAAAALTNSVSYALMAAAIALVVGGCAAWAASQGSAGARLVDVGLTLPLGTSAVTLGLGVLIAFDRSPIDFRSAWWIVPVLHALIGIPFVLRGVLPTLRGISPRIREAAATLGADPRAIRREIDFPLATKALLVGAAFAFAVSLGEFGATSFVPRRPSTTTAPTAIFRLLGQPGDQLRGQAMALSVILMLVTAASALVIERFAGRDRASGGGFL